MHPNDLQLGLVPIEVNKLVTNKLDYQIMENINDKEETKALSQDAVSGSVFLQVGMKVKIKTDDFHYIFDSGKIKTITKDLPNFGKSRAFCLDGDDGIWCIEDFEYCVNYPHLAMR